jgi:MFS family permease
MSAVALNSAAWQGNRIIAPAIAGFIIDLVSTEATFFLSGVGFLALAAVMYRLRVPRVASGSRGSPAHDMVEGLNFIRKNSIFSFLIGMTFFNSFFGTAYVMLMPIFAVDVLEVGARGQGLLLGIGGAGALLTTLWLSTRQEVQYKGLLIVGGGAMFGLALAAFALTSRFVGSFPLALAIMLMMGIFQSTYMISIQSSLQMLVPDHLRGRVMGFYGITWSIMPLGGLQAGALASFITAPFAIAVGGLAVAAFALGPALVNPKVRHLGEALRHRETAASPGDQAQLPTRASADD